jgi:proline iminopeptidase
VLRLLVLVALAGLALAQPREGFLNVPGGPVWYRISGEGKGTPVLALHGGPGGTSCGFSALAPLGADRRVIAYDQLGSGRSGRPADPTLWQVDRYVEELHAVRKQLGLRRVHLLGHSWGASLAAAYVLAKGTQGIASLTLASPLLSTPDWIRDAEELKRQLPAEVQATLRKHETAGTTNHPDYRRAEAEYTRRFVRRSAPAPPNPACAESIRNNQIYETMWGPTEFYATGTLQSFDLTPRLASLRLPVLLMTGEFDEARPETAARYQKLIPGSRLEVIPGAAHALFADNPARTLQVLADFFRANDRRPTETREPGR